MKRICLRILLTLACCATTTAQAQVSAKDQAQLADALTAGEPCCVIDGRNATNRQQKPLANALAYRTDLVIKPTAAVVVIGDKDAEALAIATAIGRKHPNKPIIAVKGGLPAWEAASATAAKAFFVPGGMSQSFVIPKNTCESGSPIQKLFREKLK